MKPSSRTPPGYATSRSTSVNPAHGQIAERDLGRSAATFHWLMARYETPFMPTLPLDQDWAAAQSITWTMSSASWSENRIPTPSEDPNPRRSTLMTEYPRGTQKQGSGASQLVYAEKVIGSGERMKRYCVRGRYPKGERRGRTSLPYGCALIRT